MRQSLRDYPPLKQGLRPIGTPVLVSGQLTTSVCLGAPRRHLDIDKLDRYENYDKQAMVAHIRLVYNNPRPRRPITYMGNRLRLPQRAARVSPINL